MIPKKFKFDIGDGTEWDVHAEAFRSSAELMAMMHSEEYQKRKPTDKDFDYFNKAVNTRAEHSVHWAGFRDAAHLKKLIENGCEDTSMMRDVQKYAHKAVCAEHDKLTRKCHEVVGGGVDVPEFLSGSPECMWGFKKKKVKSRIIKVGINCKALCDIDKDEFAHAGALIAKVIAKLEKAGYRIRLLAIDGYEDSSNRTFYIISTMIKRENEPMNYRRVLFPLTEMAFHRGVGFAWMARNGSPYIWGLGGEIYNKLRGDREEREHTLYSQACGTGDHIILSQVDIIGLYHRHGDEWTEKYIESKFLSLS